MLAKLKETTMKTRIAAKAKIEQLKTKAFEREQERVKDRLTKLEKIDNRVEKLKEYTNERLQKLEEARLKAHEQKGGKQ